MVKQLIGGWIFDSYFCNGMQNKLSNSACGKHSLTAKQSTFYAACSEFIYK